MIISTEVVILGENCLRSDFRDKMMKIMEPPRKWLVQCAHPIIIINALFILFFKMYQIMLWIFSLDTNSCTHCNKFDKWVWRRSLLQVRCWMEADLINGYFGLFNIWGCANKYVWLSYITCLFFIGWVDGLRGSPGGLNNFSPYYPIELGIAKQICLFVCVRHG